MEETPRGQVATDRNISYEQAEVKGWCWLSRDHNLRKAIQMGVDIHIATASLMFGVLVEAVTKAMRQRAKTLTFGTLYQMSAKTLAKTLRIPVAEAYKLQDMFFAAYPQGYQWIKDIQRLLMETRVFDTVFGRKLRFSVIPGNEHEALRQFVNYPIQNLAGDLTIHAGNRVHRMIQRGELGQTRLLLNVHDSLIGETKEDASEVALAIKREMERDILDGFVIFTADCKIGPKWGTMTKIKEIA